ncbi:MAG: dihydroxy-acid dehydratase [Rhodobacteraceae bacterium]|nr:dihydroxy-acid dehydratase [Paracoccaceae bacterium]
MIGRDSHDDINRYEVWPWNFGLVLAAVIVYLIFAYAQPIS